MAEKVYELLQVRGTGNRWQMPEDEMQNLMDKFAKIRDQVGAKQLARFTTYSSEWRGVSVWVYPDMEAYHKWVKGYRDLNAEKYWEFDITLGFEPPA